MTEKTARSKNNEVYIGFTDLTYDADQIQSLLENKNAKGVLLNLWEVNGKDCYVYRPTESKDLKPDAIKIVRQFLAITAVYGGKAALKTITDEKEIPEQSIDFDEFYETLVGWSRIFKDR